MGTTNAVWGHPFRFEEHDISEWITPDISEWMTPDISEWMTPDVSEWLTFVSSEREPAVVLLGVK